MLTQAQIDIRKTGIGASEIGAVAGLSPYAGPLDIYLRKLDLVEDNAGEAALWGQRLEPIIAEEYERRTGIKLSQGETRRHPKEPWIIATPDRIAKDRLVECKTASLRVAHRWGEPETDQVPEEYLAQAMWQMLVYGAKRVDFALLLGGQEFRTYIVRWDAELAQLLIKKGRAFWFDHVLAAVPPPKGSAQAIADLLRHKHPANTQPMRSATAEEMDLLRRLAAARAKAQAANEEKELLEAMVKQAIGDAEGISASFGRVTWKKNKDSRKVNWEAVARELGASDDLIEKHTTTKPGPRVLRCKFEDEE